MSKLFLVILIFLISNVSLASEEELITQFNTSKKELFDKANAIWKLRTIYYYSKELKDTDKADYYEMKVRSTVYNKLTRSLDSNEIKALNETPIKELLSEKEYLEEEEKDFESTEKKFYEAESSIYKLAMDYNNGKNGKEKDLKKAVSLILIISEGERYAGDIIRLNEMIRYEEKEKGSEINSSIENRILYDEGVAFLKNGDLEKAKIIGKKLKDIGYDRSKDLLDNINKIEQNKISKEEQKVKKNKLEILFKESVKDYKNKNYEKAFEGFKTLSEEGERESQYNLAVMYQEGQGTSKDLGKALEWYKKAGLQGDSEASYNVGIMFENGVGTDISITEAKYWYTKSASGGHSEAGKELRRLGE